jgi:iron complex outermembrane receptor protein
MTGFGAGFGKAALFATISLGALAPALAQTEQAAAPGAEEAETIVVTGTRRTDRTVADSPVPVDVISGAQLTQTGLTETNKILNQLVPSFNFPQPSIADGTDVLRPASLRGLAPDQTLVLVNGKRRHVTALLNINGTVGRGSAAVDLNLIPALAIERIEVLRDGASSQYGSDAIAGVINIQLRKASSGGTATATYGKYVTTLDGVANVTGLQTTAGQPVRDASDNRYFAANSDGELKERDGEIYTLASNIGLSLGGSGYLNVTAEYRDRNATNRSGFDLRPNYIATTLTSADPRELTFDRRNFRFGDAKTEDFNFFVNMGTQISEAFELYAFASYGKRDGLSAANYRQQNAAANRDFGAITPATTPSVANFTALTPDGFLPKIQTDLEDYSLAAGLRGDIGEWSTDFSFAYGDNSFDFGVRDSLNTSLGAASPRTFDAGGLGYTQGTINVDVSREFDLGFAKPLSVAFGAEYRDETFKIRPGDLPSYQIGPLFRASIPATTAANCTTQGGVFTAATSVCSFPGRVAPAGAQGFPGIPAASATDEGRNSFAGYVELDTDLAEGLTTTIAGRYEHFSDFGDTFNAKFAARYELADGFAVRGSVSNGFRAPSLHQQFFTTTSTNFIGGLPVDISTVAVNSPVARALGSTDLKPEKSLNITLGASASPVSGLTVTFDYYNIKIDDRVVLTENLGAAGSGTAAVNTAVKAVLDANGFQSVGAARFFINGLDTTTKGFDVVATYRAVTESIGTWNLSAAYNQNDQKIDRRLNTLGALAAVPGIVLFGRVEGIRFTDGQPKNKLVLSADGDINKFGLTARTTRYGTVISPGAANPTAAPTSLTALGPDDITLSPKWVTDLELRYDLLEDRLALAIGANNLFDVYPDRSPFGARPASAGGGLYPANQQYIPYSGFSPFGFNGRFLYARATVKF